LQVHVEASLGLDTSEDRLAVLALLLDTRPTPIHLQHFELHF
jgi:hypothetical protein